MSKKMSKKNIILLAAGGAAVVIAAVVILLVILLRPKTINLDNYISVKYSGYNGYGTAEIVIDYNKMIDDMSEKLDKSETKRLKKGIKEEEKLTFKLDTTSDLTNGDTIKLDVKIKRSFFENYKLKLEVNTKKFEVSGLKELTVLSPFDVLEITYSGYDPYCEPILTNTSTDEFLQENIYFHTDAYEVAGGDRFTVYANYSSDFMITGGYSMTETEKEYEATDLPQPKEFDPFELLEYSFSGVDGDGDLEYNEKETDDDFLECIWFSANKSYNLSSGDEITFSVRYYGTPERYGYKFTREEMTITVPTLASYIKDLSSVSEAHHEQMKNAALNAAQTYFDNGISGGYMYNSTSYFDYTYMSNFTSFTNLKVTNAYHYTTYSNNVIGYIISVDLGGNEDATANGTAYIKVEIKNPIILPDGTLDASFAEYITVDRSAYKTYDVMFNKDLQYESDFEIISL